MEGKSFISALFDFSLKSYITPRFMKFLFIVGIVLAALGTLGVLISGFTNGILPGIIALIFSPVIFLLCVLGIRVTLEIIMVLFRIQSDVQKIAQRDKQ